MNKEQHKDRLFSQKMQNFSKEPPAEIWEGIKEELQDEKTRILPVFWKYAASVLILIGIGTAVFISNYIGNQSDEEYLSDNNEQAIIDDKKLTEPESAKKSQTENDQEVIQNLNKENDDNEKHYYPQIKNVTATNSESEIKTRVAENKNVFEEDKNSAKLKEKLTSLSYKDETSAGVVAELPLQIEPGAGQRTGLRQNKFRKNYSWEDLKSEEFTELADNEGEQKESRFSLSAMLSPLYTYRDLDNTPIGMNEVFNDSESGKISYAGGINIGYKAGKRLSLHSGLIFSRYGIRVNDIFTVAELKNYYWEDMVQRSNASSAYLVNNSIGSIEQGGWHPSKYEYSSQNTDSYSAVPNSSLTYLDAGGFYNPARNYVEEEGNIEQYFQYLEVPLMLKYKVIERKVDVKLLGGISTNFLVGNRVYYNKDDNSEFLGHTSNIQTINYSGNVGVGIDYDLLEQFRFLFEPQFKYYLNSVNTKSLIGNRPYSFGLYTGFVYLF